MHFGLQSLGFQGRYLFLGFSVFGWFGYQTSSLSPLELTAVYVFVLKVRDVNSDGAAIAKKFHEEQKTKSNKPTPHSAIVKE